MTFFDPRMADGAARAVLMTGPFGDPERVIDLARPMTIAEVIAENDLAFRLPTIAVMGGEPVLRGVWAVRVVRPGEVVAFIAVPRGGGENGNTKQIVGLVAALALSIAAPMVGGWAAATFFGGSALASSVVSAALLAGGSLLLNTMLTPAQTPADQQQADTVYTANASSNQATPLDVLPVLYGRLRFPPRYASRPYSEYRGNDQYLYQLFAITAGRASIERIDIGETEAWSAANGYSDTYDDITFEIVQPGQAVTLFPANVVTSTEVAGQQVPDPPGVLGPYTINGAGTTINRIAVDFLFPGGLYTVNKKGVANRSVKLRAQYREIDDAGDPVGDWADVFRQTITYATRTPQRITKDAAVPAGRYQVQFLSEQAFSGDNDQAVDTVVWAGLRGYLTGFVTPPNSTLLAMRAKANEQLSQAASAQINVIATRHLPVWDDDHWTADQETRSIAWAAADLLRNTDYGLSLSDLQYDLATLAALAETWADRGDTFNAIFDRSWTAGEALRAILRAGRASPVRIGGKVGFNRLQPKFIKRAVFDTRNVVRGSFQHKLVLFDEEKPDSVKASYLDETVWKTREVKCSIGAIGAELPQKTDYFGITDHDQVWREGVTDAAINAYQREFVSFSTEWEGKLLVRGDPVLVQHPFIDGIQIAALRNLAGNVLTIDRDVDAGEAPEHYVVVRGFDGREWGPCLLDEIAGREITLNAADRTNIEAQMGDLVEIMPDEDEEPAHVLICEGETRPFDGLIVSAIPRSDGKVDVLCVNDAPEVYVADDTEVMPPPWANPTLPPVIPARPLVLGLVANLRAGIATLELDVMWRPSPGAFNGYVADISYDDGQTWTPVYSGTGNRFTKVVLDQPLWIRVAAVGGQTGPYSIKTFNPEDVPHVGVSGDYLDDDAVAVRHLTQDLRAAVNAITSGDPGSVAAILQGFDDRLEELSAAVLDLSVNQDRRVVTVERSLGTAHAKISEETLVRASETDAAAAKLDITQAAFNSSLAAVAQEVDTVANDLTAEANARIALGAQVQGDLAALNSSFQAIVGPEGSLTAQVTDLFAKYNDVSAEGAVGFSVGVAPAGVTARYVVAIKVNDGLVAAQYLDVVPDGAGGYEGRFAVVANRLYMLDVAEDYVGAPFAIENGNVKVTSVLFEHMESLDGSVVIEGRSTGGFTPGFAVG